MLGPIFRTPDSGLRTPDSGLRTATPVELTTEDPATWWPLIRRRVRWRNRSGERDEVASDVMLALMLHVRAGKRVDSLPGLIDAMARTSITRLRRRRALRLIPDPDALAVAGPTTATADPPIPSGDGHGVQELRRELRGRRQLWFFDRSVEGWTSEQMASALGWQAKEVRNQVNDLVVKIRELRERRL